jgi:hypothetical protein
MIIACAIIAGCVATCKHMHACVHTDACACDFFKQASKQASKQAREPASSACACLSVAERDEHVVLRLGDPEEHAFDAELAAARDHLEETHPKHTRHLALRERTRATCTQRRTPMARCESTGETYIDMRKSRRRHVVARTSRLASDRTSERASERQTIGEQLQGQTCVRACTCGGRRACERACVRVLGYRLPNEVQRLDEVLC